MQHAIRRRVSGTRNLATHRDVEQAHFDRGEKQRKRDPERDRATVRPRTRPAQTALPGLRVAGERQRCHAMPVDLNDVPAIKLCGQASSSAIGSRPF